MTFKLGESGNPTRHGKRGRVLSDAFQRRLLRAVSDEDTGEEMNVANKIADKLIAAAAEGSALAIREISIGWRASRPSASMVRW